MKKFKAVTALVCMIALLGGCASSGSTQETAVDENATTEVAASSEAVVEATGEVYKLKLGHILTADHPDGLAADEFARLVNEKTNGMVEISVFPSSQLGTAQETFDALAIGAIDFTIDGFGEPAKQYTPFVLLDAPYIADDRDHLMRILESDVVSEMYDEMSEVTDVSVLGSVYYGARYITTNDFEVRNPSDLSGKIIRVPDQSMYVSTLDAMGAVATPMAFTEVFMALKQNVVDGQENPLATIYSNKFYEVQKYLMKTEHIIGGNILMVSNKTMEKLPAEYQQAIIEAGEEACAYGTEKAFELEDQYLDQLLAEGMVLIEDIDDEAFRASVESVFENPNGNWEPEMLERIRAVE